MGRLSTFTFITLNGNYAGPGGDISWHRHGHEEAAYSLEGLKSESVLLFGRITYDLMAGYWPTPAAMTATPLVAAGMNAAEKVVFSRTLKQAHWNNTRIVSGRFADEVRTLKASTKKDLTLLGSGSILTQLADEDLVDEYQIMLDPVALDQGMPIFSGLKQKLDLDLKSTRAFASGVVVLSYTPRSR
jgi:dihydrofolate reductase